MRLVAPAELLPSGCRGRLVGGYDAVERYCRSAREPSSSTQQIVANVVVMIDGDDARSRCSFVAQHVRSGEPGGNTHSVGGTYRDDLVREAQAWGIRRRDVIVTWTRGNPSVVVIGP
jgi:hypothetical protein